MLTREQDEGGRGGKHDQAVAFLAFFFFGSPPALLLSFFRFDAELGAFVVVPFSPPSIVSSSTTTADTSSTAGFDSSSPALAFPLPFFLEAFFDDDELPEAVPASCLRSWWRALDCLNLSEDSIEEVMEGRVVSRDQTVVRDGKEDEEDGVEGMAEEREEEEKKWVVARASLMANLTTSLSRSALAPLAVVVESVEAEAGEVAEESMA
jgi:hypothetical protein